MGYSFSAWGHANVRAAHRNTIEFTRNSYLSVRADCIMGVRADFDLTALRALLDTPRLALTVRLRGHPFMFRVVGVPNRGFSSKEEMVLRRGDFLSERTFMTRCDRACSDLPREWPALLRNPDQEIVVVIEGEVVEEEEALA